MSQIAFPYTPRDWAKPLHQLMGTTAFRCLVSIVHRRAGKSWFGAAAIVMGALTVQGRYGIVGPHRATMKAIFWPLLKNYLADIPGVEYHLGDLSITVPCANGGTSIISIHSAGDADQGSNIRGLQFQGLFVDEADQIGQEAFWAELYPTQANLDKPWMIVSGTPRGDQLLADLLRAADTTPGWHGAQLDVYSTGVLAEAEIDTIKKQMPADQFAREMMARTDVAVANQLIKIEDILAAIKRVVSEYERQEVAKNFPKVMGIDLSRLRDATVFCIRQGPLVLEYITLPQGATTQEIAIKALNVARDHKIDAIFADEGGMGITIIDVMKQLGLNVIGVNFGSSATDTERYLNRRAELLDAVRDWSERPNASLPPQGSDTSLQKELSAPTFQLNAHNKLQIISKDKLRQKLSRSTDHLDSLALTFSASVMHTSILDKLNETPAQQRERLDDAPIERAPDGSKYSSQRRTLASGRRGQQPGSFDEFDAHADTDADFDLYNAIIDGDEVGGDPYDPTDPYPRGGRIAW